MIGVSLMPSRGPASSGPLRMFRRNQRAVGDVMQQRRARGDINVITHLDRRDELGIASDHATIANRRGMLVVAVVIDRDYSASDVGLFADRGITQVTEVARLGPAPDARLLSLDE